MSADKFVTLQHQMRNNQEELQSFLRDLDSWETDIKKKDEKLKTPAGGKEEIKHELPPVRNSLQKKKKKKKKKPKPETSHQGATLSSKPKRISGYDYRAWDKFDVDKVCDESSEEPKSSSEEYETDEEWEVHRKKQQAVMEKEKGNQYFKEGKYDEAIECYTRGIDCDPANALLPANRAMALLKQQKYAAAENDCTEALVIDPTYVKAYSRRATARLKLDKLSEALEDFEHVLKLEPGNKQATEEQQKLKKKLAPPEPAVPTADISAEQGVVNAIYKEPGKRSKKPLRRMVIEEIGVDEEEEKRKQALEEALSAQSNTKKRITQEDGEKFDKLVNKISSGSDNLTEEITPGGSPPNSALNVRDTVSDKSRDIVNKEDITSDVSSLAVGIQKLDTEKDISFKDTAARTRSDSSKNKVTNVRASVTEDSSPDSSPRVPSAPTSSYQFQADWKVLKNHPQKFFQYFKQIQPSTLPKLMGQALDADMFVQIVKTLNEFYIPSSITVYPVLKCLSEVKRFSMTVMFLSPSDKKVVQQLISHIATKGECDKEECDRLSKKYEV